MNQNSAYGTLRRVKSKFMIFAWFLTQAALVGRVISSFALRFFAALRIRWVQHPKNYEPDTPATSFDCCDNPVRYLSCLGPDRFE
jgi:hypothetical protein